MKRSLIGLATAAGLWLGTPSESHAQFSLSIGNPYTATGLSVGNNPFGYGNGNGYGYPGTSYYSRGYRGAVPRGGVYSPGSYGVYRPLAPAYPYGYGYGGYPGNRSYGYRRGFGIPGVGGFNRGYRGGYGRR